MTYQFNSEHAVLYGVEEAVMLQNIIFWVEKNRANERHFYKGHYWTYNSVKAFARQFPFWTEKQVRRIIDNLVEKKAIRVGNFNDDMYLHTRWFCVNPSLLDGGRTKVLPKRANRDAQTGKSTSDSKPYNMGILNDELKLAKVKISSWFGRKLLTKWSDKEMAALKICEGTDPEDWEVLTKYYSSNDPYRRRDILTLLNNWPGEIDRARNHSGEMSARGGSAFEVKL